MGPGTIRLLRRKGRGSRWLRAGACALLATFLLVPCQASAQQVDGDTGTARSQTIILDAGSVAKKSDMNFGSIAQSSGGGTVVLSPQSTATCTVTGTMIRNGTCKAAAFTIRGRRNERVRIRELNGGTVTLNGPSGATMMMDTMTFSISGVTATSGANGWDFGNWKINTANGITDFYVGGTLHVGPAQTPGVYNGSLLIQIQFN